MASGEGSPWMGYWESWMHFSNCTYKGFTKEFLTHLEWRPMKEINEATGPRISTHLPLKAGLDLWFSSFGILSLCIVSYLA